MSNRRSLPPVHLSTAELQAVEKFTGAAGAQDPRRWWMTLEMVTCSPSAPGNEQLAKLLKLFDLKMHGEAAAWADDTPEVVNIVQGPIAREEAVQCLRKMFLRRFTNLAPRPTDLNLDWELDELKQGESETLDEYHTRALRILTEVCEDSYVDGIPRTMSRAESWWVRSVISRFIRGLNNKWVELQVSEPKPDSLQKAYTRAKEQTWMCRMLVDMGAEL